MSYEKVKSVAHTLLKTFFLFLFNLVGQSARLAEIRHIRKSVTNRMPLIVVKKANNRAFNMINIAIRFRHIMVERLSPLFIGD